MHRLRIAGFFLALALGGIALAAEPPPKHELIYGAELMTHQEREQYRQRLRGAKGAASQDEVRGEHRKRMRERARVRGVEISEPQGVVGKK